MDYPNTTRSGNAPMTRTFLTNMESMTSLVDLGMSSFDASVSGVGSRSYQMFHQIATSNNCLLHVPVRISTSASSVFSWHLQAACRWCSESGTRARHVGRKDRRFPRAICAL